MLLKIFAFFVLVYTIFRILRVLFRTLARIAPLRRPPEDGRWRGPRPPENDRAGENVEDAKYKDI